MLRIRFGDLEEGEDGCIQSSEATQIKEFVDQYKQVANKIIVNCDGGVSRSPAVAAAIARYLGLDDMFIWGNGIYSPNMTVYKLLLSVLMENDSVTIDDDKVKLNIRL